MLTVAGVIASTGTAVVGARNLLNIQAERARYIREQSQNAAGAGLDEAMAEAFAEQL